MSAFAGMEPAHSREELEVNHELNQVFLFAVYRALEEVQTPVVYGRATVNETQSPKGGYRPRIVKKEK